MHRIICWVFQPSYLNSFSSEFFQQYFATSHSATMKTILALAFLAFLQFVLASPEPRRRYSSSSYSSSQWNQNQGNLVFGANAPYIQDHTTARSPYPPGSAYHPPAPVYTCQCADISWVNSWGNVMGNCQR